MPNWPRRRSGKNSSHFVRKIPSSNQSQRPTHGGDSSIATPRDPLVLVGVMLAMALLGLLATWIPARRALSVNPMILLREE